MLLHGSQDLCSSKTMLVQGTSQFTARESLGANKQSKPTSSEVLRSNGETNTNCHWSIATMILASSSS